MPFEKKQTRAKEKETDMENGIEVVCADALGWLAGQEECSLDAVICDPPYGLEFMGKEWDKPGALWHDQEGLREKDIYVGTDGVIRKKASMFSQHHPTPIFCAGTAYQEWCREWGRLALRALKPGGWLLAFGGTRTIHRLTCGLEDAGFEIRDMIEWFYGSGFPKSFDVSKGFDYRAFAEWLREVRPGAMRWAKKLWNATEPKDGAAKDKRRPTGRWLWRWCEVAEGVFGELLGKREVVGRRNPFPPDHARPNKDIERWSAGRDGGLFDDGRDYLDVTAPATELAREWEGYGMALKPSHEPILVARKPLEGNVCDNVERWGAGALNVDGCRVNLAGMEEHRTAGTATFAKDRESADVIYGTGNEDINSKQLERQRMGLNPRYSPAGRWPPNLVFSHAVGCVRVGTKRVVSEASRSIRATDASGGILGRPKPEGSPRTGYRDADGREEVAAWECVEGCPVAALDRQSGELTSGALDRSKITAPNKTYGARPLQLEGCYEPNTGGASRFFPQFGWADVDFCYCAKASRAERNAGCSGLELKRSSKMGAGMRSCVGHPERPLQGKTSSEDRRARNDHPTVKPVALLMWLARLTLKVHNLHNSDAYNRSEGDDTSPPNGGPVRAGRLPEPLREAATVRVADPFAGSGSSAIAWHLLNLEGYRIEGFCIDKDEHYCEIARARLEHVRKHGVRWLEVKPRAVDDKQPALF